MKLLMTQCSAKVEQREEKRVFLTRSPEAFKGYILEKVDVGYKVELPGLKFCDVTAELTFTTSGNAEGLTEEMVLAAIAKKLNNLTVKKAK